VRGTGVSPDWRSESSSFKPLSVKPASTCMPTRVIARVPLFIPASEEEDRRTSKSREEEEAGEESSVIQDRAE